MRITSHEGNSENWMFQVYKRNRIPIVFFLLEVVKSLLSSFGIALFRIWDYVISLMIDKDNLERVFLFLFKSVFVIEMNNSVNSVIFYTFGKCSLSML